MNDDGKRLAELRQLETLTDAQMHELVRLSSPGQFKKLPNPLTVGVTNVEQAHLNYKEGSSRSRHAYDHGCFIEVLSLRLQHIDLWLRMFWVARNKKGEIFNASDKRTFGALISDCEQLGFDVALVQQMRDFNKTRVECIHKYVLGDIRYDDLKSVCDVHEGLDKEVVNFVVKQIGVSWTC